MTEEPGPTRPAPKQPTPAGRRRSASDRRVLRGLRLRLIAWSAGSTLVVLLVLGIAIYSAVASSLAAMSIAQLQERAKMVAALPKSLMSPADFTGISSDPSTPGLTFGGPYSGTWAVVLPANTTGTSEQVPGASPGMALPSAAAPTDSQQSTPTAPGAGGSSSVVVLPDWEGYSAALRGEVAIREVTAAGSTARVISLPAEMNPLGAVVQVAVDRSDELRTLDVVLRILVLGGLAALLAAVVLGYVYAGRALVPVRASMRRQREFAADTSHELRTPLAVIRGSVEHLRRHADEPVRTVGAALDDIESEVVRLGDLVDDLLLLARDEAGALELDRRPMDLADVAAEALAALEPFAATRGVRLELDVEPAPVVADAARLRRLVAILVDNGVRHGREAGTIRVTVRPGATLEVSDDGPGIRPEDLPHVFERYWRAPAAKPGGSGLGLAIAAWIAEHHGGRIVALPAAGGGTTFRVTLPEDRAARIP
jgi:two-component system sensor histidine kinase CiaH